MMERRQCAPVGFGKQVVSSRRWRRAGSAGGRQVARPARRAAAAAAPAAPAAPPARRHLGPRRCQLDRQRQSVEPAADLDDRRRVRGRQREVRPRPPRARSTNSRTAATATRPSAAGGGDGQPSGSASGGAGESMLAANAQRAPGWWPAPQRRARPPAARRPSGRAGVDQVLAVVQHQQQPAGRGDARRARRPAASGRLLADARAPARPRRRTRPGSPARPSSTSHTPSANGRRTSRRDPQRQPGLAHPARAGQRHQAVPAALTSLATRSASAARPMKEVGGLGSTKSGS